MRTRFALLPLVVLLFSGCEKPLKDVRDYYPSIMTESVTVQSDGSVVAVGRIVTEGATPIVAAGFCASTSAVPQMLDAQGIGALQGDRFTVVYDGFATTGTYYFRAWATNENGYSYGNVLSLSDIVPQPVTPPCTPTLDFVSPGGGLVTQNYYPIDAPAWGIDAWEFTANTSAHFFTYRFGSALGTGIYTTSTNMAPGNGKVRVSFISGFTGGVLQAGHEVYVNQLSPTSWEITICNGPWGSGPYLLNTRFHVPS